MIDPGSSVEVEIIKNDVEEISNKSFNDLYSVNIKTQNEIKTFDITDKSMTEVFKNRNSSPLRVISDMLDKKYTVKTKNNDKQSKKTFIYHNDIDINEKNKQVNNSKEDSINERNQEINNIMNILQYGKYYDFKNKKVNIQYRNNQKRSQKDDKASQIQKKIEIKDYKISENKPKNLYVKNNLFDKIALKAVKIARWFSIEWLKFKNKLMENSRANTNLKSINNLKTKTK